MNPPASSRISFVGCGSIAGPYAACLARHSELGLVGVFDLDVVKRSEFADSHGCADYASLDELCADSPDIVVNLTNAPYHFETTRELLARGHTVFSEKPLSLRYHEAQELVETAAEHSVRLACAPSLWLGRAALTAAEVLSSGSIGSIRLINAEVNQGRIETWHSAPRSFYQVGPVVDAGVYPLTYLTAVFGPIRRVTASSATLLAQRTTVRGEIFNPERADSWIVAAEFESGPILRLTCNFYTNPATNPRTIDFHGDSGTLRLNDWITPGSEIKRAEYGEGFQVLVPGDDSLELDWCLGVADLAKSIRASRPHRTGAEHAAHVVEILEAIQKSAENGTPVGVESHFPSPLADTRSHN